ncbi:MAG: PIN domain-containing protein [Anaerolineaceae bacterium]|nr:PIN domain-containing protein [Anaerolineaceae bacterium]
MCADRNLEFVDTNILVYAHDLSAGKKYQKSQQLIRRLWENGKGCLSVQVLQEFYVTITRKVAAPLHLEEAEAVVRDYSFWRIHAPTAEDVLGAIDIQRQHQLSFWDAMVIHSAIQSGCGLVWSEDLNSGQEYGEVLVKNPYIG